MALTTSPQRRSSVRILQPWQVAMPSPTDTPGTLDEADRAQSTWSYGGISAALVAGGTRQEWRAAFNIWHRSSS